MGASRLRGKNACYSGNLCASRSGPRNFFIPDNDDDDNIPLGLDKNKNIRERNEM